MKFKPIAFFLIVFAFTLFACEKENVVIEPNQSAVDRIIKLPKVDRKLAFDMLSPQEKAMVWDNRFSYELNNNVSLTLDQKNFLQDLIKVSSASLFDNRHTIEEERLNTSVMDASLKLFDAEYLYRLLFTLDNASEIGLIEKAVAADCICNLSQGCFRLGSGWSLETGSCEAKKTCKNLDTGCGLFWRYSCDGDNCDFGGG